ncbi:MAG: S41 family peptidase [Byssovorax sp.]
MRRTALLLGTAFFSALGATPAFAGTFDGQGEYHKDPAAVVFLNFDEMPPRYVPADVDAKCEAPMFALEAASDALDGQSVGRFDVVKDCAERITVSLPPKPGSYRASVWMRHGGVFTSLVVLYAADSGLDSFAAELFPTGRTTSDGWVELASNEIPVDGARVDQAYLKVTTFADKDGVELDALELVPQGTFEPQKDCQGIADPVCGSEAVCASNRCVPGRISVPPLPPDAIRDEVVDRLESQLRVFYGGVFSRGLYLPKALATLESMRKQKTAYGFWNTWATAIHQLHDWHTNTGKSGGTLAGSHHRLNACFFEGDGDLTHAAWPKDPRYNDILVSHVGPGAAGLGPGDRLVAIDGVHPIEWALGLADRDWGFSIATDPDSLADPAEHLGGPFWTGGALIARYATTFTILRCDPQGGTCAAAPETIAVTSLPDADGGPDVVCDNRPLYHLTEGNNPNPVGHYVFGDFFGGKVAGTTPDEAIYGLVWDTLYGAYNPQGWVNSHLSDAIATWKQSAKGVILDHRAGNGGTLDSATLLTSFVRGPGTAAVTRMPMEVAGTPVPADPVAAKALFDKLKQSGSAYKVGGDDPSLDIPVALILHRDGSASDYLPYGMKGAPRVRIFGPHQTSGAFSTFVDLNGWGSMSVQFASGDTLGPEGEALIGHGVFPDEVILPRQSDLVAGKDTLFEAALAWVKQEIAK